MQNLSRTALKELKKRYLNILKKCFLANLMAFLCVTLATPATAGEDSLVNYHEKTYTSDVTFEDLESSSFAGAILNRGTITFGENSTATFTNNSAFHSGGAIDNDGGTITFGESSTATFTGNSASTFGGAIYNEGSITFGVESTNTFIENTASSGGAIYNYEGAITFAEGSINSFSKNTAKSGGAIDNDGGTITFGVESTNTFTNNTSSSSYGGAIYNYEGAITFAEGSINSFSKNTAKSGGAIYIDGGDITFGADSTATFTGNSASWDGGAIDNGGTITFGGDATFTNNTASSGGAIYNEGTITFGADSTVTFTNNTSSSKGGAIYNYDAFITFGGDATFTNNSASYGGAIWNSINEDIDFVGKATFTGNSASWDGGAIDNDGGTITFGGETTFTNNSSSSGGAIYNGSNSTITFGADSSVLFSNNTANGQLNDIYNYGTINFAQGEGKVGTLDGGIYQSGRNAKINKTGAGTLILGDNIVNGGNTGYTSQFNQSDGLTIARVDKLNFATTNTITGGELRVHGANLANLKASVSSGAMLTYLTTNVSEQMVALTVNGAILTFGAYTDEAKNAELALVADKKVPKLDSNGEVEYDTNGDIVYVSYDAESKLLTTGTIDRAKYKLTSDISGATKVIFKDSDVTIASGTYNAPYDFENARIENGNTITFNGNTSFKNSVKSAGNGGAIMNSGTITFGEGSSVYFNNNTANGVANDIYNSGTINILGEVKSDIHLISEGGTIGLKAKKTKDTDTDGKITYTGSYKLTNTTLDLSGDGAKEVTIENLTVSGSSTLKWDAEIKDTGDSYTVANDVLNSTATGQFTTGTINVMGGNKGECYDVIYNKSLFADGSVIGVETDGLYKTKDITNGISINFVALPKTLGEVLRSTTASTLDFGDYVTVNEGETLNYGISEKDLQSGSMGELGSGEKIIRGATDKASDTVINANGVGQIFYLGSGDKLILENLTIASAKSSSDAGAIYNYRNYAGSVTLNNVVFANNTSSSYGGAIGNIGTITFGGDATFTGNSADSGGAIYNTQGTIMLGGDTTFKGNSASTSGGVIYNYYGGTITFGGDTTFKGNSASTSGGAIYNTQGTITFGEGSSVYFNNNTANGVANDIYNSNGAINILGEVKSDIHLVSKGGSIGLKAKDTDGDGKVTYGGSYNLTNSARLDLSDDGIKEVTIENLSGSGASLMIDALFTKDTDGSITMTADKLNSENAYQFNGVTVKMSGQELLNAILSGLTLDQTGNINPAIEYKTSILGGNATLKSAKTSQLSTTSPYIYQMVTSGQDLTVTATKLANNVTPLEYLANYAGDSTLQFDTGSGALNASKVLEPLSTGTKTILGASDDASESVIEGVGQNLFVVDKADTILEMKDLSIRGVGTAIDNQAGSVALDNVIIKDTVGDTALKNGSILSLKDVTIDKAVENTGSIVGEGRLALSSLTGSGTLTMNNAVLDVADKFETTNKIVANNVTLDGKGTSEIHFADLEIAKDSTLDIKTLQATANTLTVRENATLGITLNGLGEYGTMKAEEIFAENDAKVHLSLGDNFSGGVFDVFKGSKGAGDLELVHNNVYNVVEVEEGKYSFMAKDKESLQESLGTTDIETDIANALTGGTSTDNAQFEQAQKELLVGLQSQNKGTVLKAKRALNALGARSTSIYQAQATAQFTQMHTLISQMLMNATAPIFGHAGGEDPARATVYVKGLYDRVNSLAGDGFRMRSKGAVLGVQSALTEDLTVGVGYAGINTIAKEDLRRTEVNTNTGFISAQYQPNNWWMSGVLTYSRSQYEEEKQVLSTKGKATYDVDSVGAQITTGYNIKLDNWIITPEIGVRYLNARQEGYTDSIGTTVERTNSDFVTAMGGFKVGVDLKWIRPLAGVMVGYDVITDDITSINTLSNGRTFTIQGKALDRLSTTVVAGFAADLDENTTLKLEYSGNYRKEYLDHSGMLRLEWKF